MNSFEWMMALRYVFSKKRITLIGIISKISITGVTVGVAALIVVLSVFNGFSALVEGLLKGVDPDIRIEASDKRYLAEEDSVLFSVLKEIPEISLVSRFAEGKALLTHDNENQVAWVHGVEDSLFNRMTRLDDHLVMGKSRFRSETGEKGILVGIGLSDKLSAIEGATIAAISPVGLDKVFTQMQTPRTRRFEVTGVFSVQRVYDVGFAYASFEDVQDLFQLPGKMSGVELRLIPGADAGKIKEILSEKLGKGYWVQTWYDLRREMYSIMKLEKWGAYLILALIIIIAAFNIVGTLTMTVLEKRRDIGVLMAMGTSRQQIYRIFLKQGLIVGFSGVLIGSLLGYGVVFLQMTTGFYQIPNSQSFLVDAFPVSVEWVDFLATTAMALLLTSVSAIYPARLASSLDPVEAIRYE
ncbi:MAG: FtsX-like permease family protein [Bacteroidetes bacterium]|nr:FtsX-like permease family protein [Bacteroidota bacterium]